MRQYDGCSIHKQTWGTKLGKLCILLWKMIHRIQIYAAHIPGKKNCLVDKLSWGQVTIKSGVSRTQC